MNVQHARFTNYSLELIIDDRLAVLDTKKSLLDAGIAYITDMGTVEPYWAERTQAVWPADPEDNRRRWSSVEARETRRSWTWRGATTTR